MTALPGRQFRLDENVYNMKMRSGLRQKIEPCPVCGHPRRMAQACGILEPGCSTVCNDTILRQHRRARAHRKAEQFLAWKEKHASSRAP